MGERGYHAISIQMIADAIGVTKGTIFHHFKNKEGILLAILDEVGPVSLKILSLIVENEKLSGMEKLESAIRFDLDLVARKSNFLKILFSESRHLSEQNRRRYQHYEREFVDLTEGLIKQVQSEDRKHFNKMSPRIVAHAILGMCLWTNMWLSTGERKIAEDEVVDHFMRILN